MPGSFDTAYLGILPNFVVMSPSGRRPNSCTWWATAAAYDKGPIAFRYPRGEGVRRPSCRPKGEVLEIGQGPHRP